MAFQVEEIQGKTTKKACAWGNIKNTSVKVCSERYISKRQIWRHSTGQDHRNCLIRSEEFGLYLEGHKYPLKDFKQRIKMIIAAI